MLTCDECGAHVDSDFTQVHLDYHKNVADSFIGFVEILKAIAGPEFKVVIEGLDNRHQE